MLLFYEESQNTGAIQSNKLHYTSACRLPKTSNMLYLLTLSINHTFCKGPCCIIFAFPNFLDPVAYNGRMRNS